MVSCCEGVATKEDELVSASSGDFEVGLFDSIIAKIESEKVTALELKLSRESALSSFALFSIF